MIKITGGINHKHDGIFTEDECLLNGKPSYRRVEFSCLTNNRLYWDTDIKAWLFSQYEYLVDEGYDDEDPFDTNLFSYSTDDVYNPFQIKHWESNQGCDNTITIEEYIPEETTAKVENSYSFIFL